MAVIRVIVGAVDRVAAAFEEYPLIFLVVFAEGVALGLVIAMWQR